MQQYLSNMETDPSNCMLFSFIHLLQNEHYAAVIQEMKIIPESSSSRHKIMDFFNRILVEYEEYGKSGQNAVLLL